MPRRVHSNPNVPTLADFKAELRSLRPDLMRTLTVPGPNKPKEHAALIKKLERSARAEQRLRKLALDYAKSRKT